MSNLNDLMELCGFDKPGDAGIYKSWQAYLQDALEYAAKASRVRKSKKATMALGLYTLFIEFLAGRLPNTTDDVKDGAVYMSRAAMEFRDRFIRSMMEGNSK